jgi:NADPH:quinone reductase-like Zn-dependent oxidoreductase
MKTMKSYTTTSLPPYLALITTVPVPTLPPNSTALLLRITHVSLNPADLVCLRLLPAWIPFLRSNPVPGMDFAGEVVCLGAAVPAELGLRVGDRVCGAAGLWEVAVGRGTLAEFAVLESGLVAKVPAVGGRAWGGREAVGVMGIAGQTAALMAGSVVGGLGGVEGMRGRRVLVNGASGGVGTVLVQICKGLGAEVVGVCSGANRALVERLGVDEVSWGVLVRVAR